MHDGSAGRVLVDDNKIKPCRHFGLQGFVAAKSLLRLKVCHEINKGFGGICQVSVGIPGKYNLKVQWFRQRTTVNGRILFGNGVKEERNTDVKFDKTDDGFNLTGGEYDIRSKVVFFAFLDNHLAIVGVFFQQNKRLIVKLIERNAGQAAKWMVKR